MNYSRLTYPSAETSLITLDDLKKHLRIMHDTEDALIQGYLDTAIFHYEDFTGRIVNQTEFKCTLDHFPGRKNIPIEGFYEQTYGYSRRRNRDVIELMRYPITEITKIEYANAEGIDQELDLKYCRIDYSEPTRLSPALNCLWPTTAPVLGAVTITFTCGCTDMAQLRPSSRQSILMMAGHFYNNRESVVVGRVTNEVPQSARLLMENDKISNRL